MLDFQFDNSIFANLNSIILKEKKQPRVMNVKYDVIAKWNEMFSSMEVYINTYSTRKIMLW